MQKNKHSYFLTYSFTLAFATLLMTPKFVFAQKGGGVLTTGVTATEFAVNSNIPTKATCSAAKVAEVLDTATQENDHVYIDCSLTLRSTDVVTKRLIFQGSEANGVIFNGNGATLNGGEGTINNGKDMIEVRSRSFMDGNTRRWTRPESVTIKNCKIIGSMRIWGMALNGQGKVYTDGTVEVNHFKNSSFTSGHVTTARNNAPKNIILDHLTITGVSRNPLYFAPGVTNCQLINSELKGESNAVAIYLDAESKDNIIRNNYIHTITKDYTFERWDRPLIAIDGSSSNYIYNNYFSSLNHGGIYFYRNCGEGGVVRHSTPSKNKIINNIFYYNNYTGDNPAVYLASKNRDAAPGVLTLIPDLISNFWDNHIGFCEEDAGHPFGSSVSDLDYARENVIMQNRFYKRSVSDMIKTQNIIVNSPNYIALNETVQTASPRSAGCYVGPNGYQREFILHGQSIEVLEVYNGEPKSFNYSCNNGVLTRTTQNSEVSKLVRHFGISSSNNGLTTSVACPAGRKIIGATAAYNLESGTVTEAMIENVATNTIQIIRPSDYVSDGLGWIGTNQLRSGSKMITGVDGLTSVTIGCKEHDSNGGDCDFRVVLYCR